tara:strand:- start:406 stop:1584 length:1179 start_codon:yes stop_codon:yes gene_type:complete
MNNIRYKFQQFFFILLGIFIPTSIAITNVLIIAIVLCWLLEGNWKYKIYSIKESKWMLCIFALILLYVFGLLWGENHLNAGWQFQRLALLLTFPIFTTIEINQKTIRRAVLAFLCTAFISALIALSININLILPLGNYIEFIDISWRNSAFITYNYHNVILALAANICIYILFEMKSNYNYIFLIFLLTFVMSIFTETGRAGQVIFTLSTFFYIVYFNKKNIIKIFSLLLLLGSFQFLAYTYSSVYKYRVDTLSNVIKNNGDLGVETDIRYVFFRQTIKKIFNKPILGHGTGSFGTIFKETVNSGHFFNKHTTPHNQYLYVWFELGILGLVLLILIFYYQIRDLSIKKYGVQRILLPFSFAFLMMIDSYFFIFILTICYIFLFTIYSKYQQE